ncbi:MAG: hypothetical protein Q8T08_09240 [Ignavibacteria bacterium]|jgi:hypothetical protein|nr:hypothetical protein [Ignavibacteria bacterium]
MNEVNYLEIFGYVASVLVAISLMMNAIIKLRIINLVGSTCFAVYGFLIGALPVGFLNGFIALINIYYLIQIFSAKEYFKSLSLSSGSEYVTYFLNFFKNDILKFIPSFIFEKIGEFNILVILRNTNPAGIILYNNIDPQTILIELDYVMPGYRDFKIGEFAFNEFRKNGITKIYSEPGNSIHKKYLKKMGFAETSWKERTLFCKNYNQVD